MTATAETTADRPSTTARSSTTDRPSATPDPLATDFARLDRSIPARVAIVVFSDGRARMFGTPVAGPAWSTIKVPLAIAAVQDRAGGVADDVTAAISSSDNAAAEALWSSLGTPTDAKARVEGVLRQGEDTSTRVQRDRTRSGFTPFGQTMWPLRAQARFGWRLPCVPGGSSVVAAMRNISPSQRWGLAALAGSASKGGWGPAPDGRYLVRQFGLLNGPRGPIGVALVAAPQDGAFASGVSAIESLAQWVSRHRNAFGGSYC